MLPSKRTIGILPWTEKSYQEKEWSESFVYSLQEKNETCDDHEKYIKRKTAALRGLYEKCERILLGSHCPASCCYWAHLSSWLPHHHNATGASIFDAIGGILCLEIWLYCTLFCYPTAQCHRCFDLWCHSFWHFSVIALEFWYRADLCSCHISPMPMPHVIYR